MSKPHDETWELDEAPPDHAGHVRIIVQGSTAAFTPARARLAVAAPEMARAMLALGATVTFIMGPEWHLVECPRTGGRGFCMPICVHARHVLTKAGAL